MPDSSPIVLAVWHLWSRVNGRPRRRWECLGRYATEGEASKAMFKAMPGKSNRDWLVSTTDPNDDPQVK